MEKKYATSQRKIVFSGEKIKEFLQRNGLSYKATAEKLGIDKNTVGKLINGGNMNVHILLRFCNVFKLDITDFFKCEVMTETGETAHYFLSSYIPEEKNDSASEEMFEYKNSKNNDFSMEDIQSLIEHNNRILEMLGKMKAGTETGLK